MEGQGLTDEELLALHEKQLHQVMHILDANQLIRAKKKAKLKPVQYPGSALRVALTDPLWGSSALFGSAIALRLLGN